MGSSLGGLKCTACCLDRYATRPTIITFVSFAGGNPSIPAIAYLSTELQS
jgi:hypothetical protein